MPSRIPAGILKVLAIPVVLVLLLTLVMLGGVQGSPAVVPEILKFVLTMGGAWAAAYFGASYTLSRFRRERLFDRRLEWYGQSVRTMYEMVTLIQDMLENAVSGDGEGFHTAFAEYQKQDRQLHLVLGEAELFVDAQSFETVSRLRREQRRISVEGVEAIESMGDQITNEERLAMLQEIFEELETAILMTRSDLVRDIRTLFDLDLLPGR